jgi:cyanophycinase
MAIHLIGGGWSPAALPLVYDPFLRAAGSSPSVACVVLDEGDGDVQFERWATALTSVAPCTPLAVLVREGTVLDAASLPEADGMLVCGGLTPAYADALAPAATGIAAWLGEGNRPYAGFSAGSAVAASDALVGGWLLDGMPVCPGDAGEDLDEIAVMPGLGLVPFTVEVHAAQWGTLNRLVTAVRAGRVPSGFAIDEDTVLVVDEAGGHVGGLGCVHGVFPSDDHGVVVRSWRAGDTIDLPAP